MALVVETGAGLANANAYVDVAFVDAYAGIMGLAAWLALNTTAKETAIARATMHVNDGNRYPYVGVKRTQEQALLWPREGAVERDGQAIASTSIPYQLKNATAELAGLLGTGTSTQTVVSTSGAIKREKVDVLETEYFSSEEITGSTLLDRFPTVESWLAPLLRLVPGIGIKEVPVAGPSASLCSPPFFRTGITRNHENRLYPPIVGYLDGY